MRFVLVCAIVWGVCLTQPVIAQPSPLRGMELYENHCTACHTSQVHIREKRKAKSLAQIESWIRHWVKELKLSWTDEEVKEVLTYLNLRYYEY